jgi:multicomponent Na+:H+ antiporter subunit E
MGFLFLLVFFGIENFWLSFFISVLVSIFIFPGKYNFIKLIFDLIKLIPKIIYESLILFYLKNESVEDLKYSDDFEMLRRIIKITITPKTLVFDHDDDYIYIHKME